MESKFKVGDLVRFNENTAIFDAILTHYPLGVGWIHYIKKDYCFPIGIKWGDSLYSFRETEIVPLNNLNNGEKIN